MACKYVYRKSTEILKQKTKIKKMKNSITITLFVTALFFTSCLKEITVNEEDLSNKERMNLLVVNDPSIWNTLTTQSINTDDLEKSGDLKSAQGMQEYPKGGDYYFALFEDLFPSEGDYDFNDVILKSKLGMEKKSNKITGYFNSTLFNRGGSLPVKIGLMFYEVEGKKYTRIDFDKIKVNGTQLSNGPWTADLSDLGTEWTINFEFENKSANVWMSYFIKTDKGGEIMTGGFAPSNVKTFEIPQPQFLTDNNLPWGLEIEASKFAIPNEKELFLNAYPEFKEWAESDGVKNKKWFDKPDSFYTHN